MPLDDMHLHHLGYVVADVNSAIKSLVHSLAGSWDGRIFEDPYQRVKVSFLITRQNDAQIELVEPIGEASPVRRFLKEKGGGFHHLCYEVRDLEVAMAQMKMRGALVAKRPKPAVAFDGRRIAWVLTTEKLLIELLEQSKNSGDDFCIREKTSASAGDQV